MRQRLDDAFQRHLEHFRIKMAFEKLAPLRLFLALLWWRVCHFLLNLLHVRSLRPANEFMHKVVVVGDDFAAGLGDYVTMGSDAGIAAHLKPLVKQSDKVRHTWEIVNAGIPGSRSEDWKMNAPTQYFKNVFNTRSTGDASIVIIILGSIELRSSSANVHSIKRNLMEICDTLRKKGKRVCLATTVGKLGDTSNTSNGAAAELNTALEEFCKSTTTEDLPVVLGPRLDNYSFRRENALLYDNYHFNSSSYKLLARNTADFLIPMMTAVEWATWKDQLNKVEYDKALYD